jgi:hypothetical protein
VLTYSGRQLLANAATRARRRKRRVGDLSLSMTTQTTLGHRTAAHSRREHRSSRREHRSSRREHPSSRRAGRHVGRSVVASVHPPVNSAVMPVSDGLCPIDTRSGPRGVTCGEIGIVAKNLLMRNESSARACDFSEPFSLRADPSSRISRTTVGPVPDVGTSEICFWARYFAARDLGPYCLLAGPLRKFD